MRLIDADEALRLSKEDKLAWVYDLTDLEEFLRDVPTIDAEPVKRARWIGVHDGWGCCSNCHRMDGIDKLATHCRYCGAKMDLEVDA